jgi:protein gp37
MNKQPSPKGIEWTRVKKTIDGILTELPGYTWNPTGGCLHGCTWKMPDGSITECYAKTVAERLATRAYPKGFEHHYWRPHELKAPLKVKDPAGIFVGSMADLFGHWVPKEQIEQVIQVMKDADWHTFQTLSKNPLRLPEFNPFPSNVWVGVSLPSGHLSNPKAASKALITYLRQMEKIDADVRFMSIEPLWFDVAPVFEEWLDNHDSLPFEWAIIGAASKGSKIYQPTETWTQGLLDVLDSQDIPVFFKGNLEWNPRRDDFPQIVERDQVISWIAQPI